jgi:phage terminase small subunit
MPRKSKAALSVVTLDVTTNRLVAPKMLGAEEKALFKGLIEWTDPKHFRRSDLPLLCSYCEASVLASRAAKELREGGPVINGRPSPWLAVLDKAHRAQVALSQRLRLSPQSRLDPRTAGKPGAMTDKPWDWTAKVTDR